MIELETDKLTALVRQKRDLLIRFREMGQRQLQLVCEGSMGQLLDVLAAKQRLLDALERVERWLDPFRGQDPGTRQWRSAEARDACAELLDECERLLHVTVQQERESEAALMVRRDEAAERLQNAHLADQARGAYARGGAGPIRQLDLTSEY
ncbi:MAG: hypothetical protein ACOX1P_12625 [Thermoguttaceae bacterium]|jgi:hypothetical protein